MADNKTKATEASVPSYLSAIDEARRKDCEALAKLMTKATKQQPSKDDISVYLGASFPGHEHLLSKLGKHKMGGGCLHVRNLSDVDLKVLEQLIVGSVAERKHRHGQG